MYTRFCRHGINATPAKESDFLHSLSLIKFRYAEVRKKKTARLAGQVMREALSILLVGMFLYYIVLCHVMVNRLCSV